jgi:hypothetical protein
MIEAAKVIVTHRTGIEVVESIMKKFSISFEAACNIWNGAVKEIIKLRSLNIPFLEVDQFDMTNNPDAIAQKITSFLGRPEKASEMAALFRDTRTDQLSSHDWSRRMTLKDAGWGTAEQNTFVLICGSMMREFGYSL